MHAEGVPEALELSDGSRAPPERKIVGASIPMGKPIGCDPALLQSASEHVCADCFPKHFDPCCH